MKANSATHVSEKNRSEAEARIARKLEAIRSYANGGKATFELPEKHKFTYNWFCSFEDKDAGFERVSKASDLLKSGRSLHTKVVSALNTAQSRLEASQVKARSSTVSGVRDEIKRLKAENAELKHRVKGLVKNTVDLIKERDEYKARLGIQQAQWLDSTKTSVHQL